MIAVSVIVPSFKRVEQTLRTLNLLMSSRGIGMEFACEFIVVDSSPDDSLKNALEEKFKNKIVYVRPKKPGISTNKNKGGEVAKGGILVFCDSDIEVEKDTLLKTVEYLKNNKNAGAVTGNVNWKNGAFDGQRDRPEKGDRIVRVGETRYIESIYSRYIATYKKVFEAVGGYDEEVFNMRGEGADLSIRYWRTGFPLAYDPKIVVNHIYDAPDSVGNRIKNVKRSVARDLFLLGYKYDVFEGPNFKKISNSYFKIPGKSSNNAIFKALEKNFEGLAKAKLTIDRQKESDLPFFNFKFLEVFSDKTHFKKCVNEAKLRLFDIRKSVGFD